MKPKALIILAPGFEEMEAVISIDMLRRASVDVAIACLDDRFLISGSRNIQIQAEASLDSVDYIPDALILPGGMPGAKNLAQSDKVIELIQKTNRQNKIIAAICASPAHALVKAKILENKKVTCYPGCEDMFESGTEYTGQDVVADGNIITASGPGTAFLFALVIIEKLCGKSIADKVKSNALIDKS
jgi:4-methyl-5(b-hydroxyethyl)-thiazole monophosphate biosynthesis